MRPETQAIIAEVEQRAGRPVQILPTEGLGVVAKITMSPHVTDSYVLEYRPGISFKDYAVAFQCGFLLRVLAVPEVDRRQFALRDSATAWAGKLVREHLLATRRPPLPDEVAASFASQLAEGLLTQLRSIPIGMRVDEWLAKEYSTLDDLQAESFAMQQKEALGSLSPQVKAMVPDEIIAGSILLNTAYALFCDRLLGSAIYQVPYVSAGFKELGAALLKIYDETPSDPTSDISLVDRWGAEIGLSGKYEWVPFPSSVPKVS